MSTPRRAKPKANPQRSGRSGGAGSRSARRSLTAEQRERKNARDRVRRAEQRLEKLQAQERQLRGRLKRSRRRETKESLRAELRQARERQSATRATIRTRGKKAPGERGRPSPSQKAGGGRLSLWRKPPREVWKGPFRKYTTSCPRKGNFQGVALVRARFESQPKKGMIVVPVPLGWTNRKELRELGVQGVLELVAATNVKALDAQLIGVVALKPRKGREGVRVHRRRSRGS